ncbi:hypothetical protein N0V90_009349 [Kalmusia sp. IMI 367209]|nr:hypothetical protein N0V90_009349 [Kalmusia sp. IMI 367209]
MGSSDSDGQAPSRKRSRTSANGEEAGAGGKKARGRPRVDTQDETAADIRLAQRAYRQRKETTIASLKEQNDRLQSIIEQMNKSFLQFNESALKSGLLQLNPRLAQQLKSVTESFVSLAKSAAEGHEDEEDLVEPSEAIPLRKAKPQSIEARHVDVGWGYSTSLEQRSPPHPASPSPTRDNQSQSNDVLAPLMPNFNTEQARQGATGSLVHYRRPMMPDQVFNQGVSWGQTTTDEQSSSKQLPFGLVDLLSRQDFTPPHLQNPSIYSVNIPTPRATPPMPRLPTPPHLSLSLKTPKSIWTYSHDETTFARRLTRASLETGFHLLGSAHERPAALEYVFRLSLPYMSLNELRDRFKELLSRGTDEDLDCWGTPFIHLGGAGTHYPRKDVHGNIIKLPNAWTVRRIGPIDKKMIRAENADDPSQSHDLNIDLTGFEGEWFDSHDVEGYLEHEKGVRINPRKSFVEALVDDDEQLPGDYGDDYFAMNAEFKPASPVPRRSSDESDTPSFSTGSSSAKSRSSISTPPNINSTSTSLETLFASSDIPFGLDMGMASDLTKLPAIDTSTFFDQPLGLDLAPGFDVGLHNTPLPSLNFPSQGMSVDGLGLDLPFTDTERIPVVKQRRKKLVLIDVTKLIDELIKHGVCLGRAPGFRKKDVDMAFQASLITTY